jgi:chitin synthase
MVACGILCAWQAVRQVSTSLLHRNMVFSLIITYGAWLLSSVLALDPWHLATCMLQYTLLSPLYLVILNM